MHVRSRSWLRSPRPAVFHQSSSIMAQSFRGNLSSNNNNYVRQPMKAIHDGEVLTSDRRNTSSSREPPNYQHSVDALHNKRTALPSITPSRERRRYERNSSSLHGSYSTDKLSRPKQQPPPSYGNIDSHRAASGRESWPISLSPNSTHSSGVTKPLVPWNNSKEQQSIQWSPLSQTCGTEPSSRTSDKRERPRERSQSLRRLPSPTPRHQHTTECRPLSPIEQQAKTRKQKQIIRRSNSFSNLDFDESVKISNRNNVLQNKPTSHAHSQTSTVHDIMTQPQFSSLSTEYNPLKYTSDKADVPSSQSQPQFSPPHSPDHNLPQLLQKTTHNSSSQSDQNHTNVPRGSSSRLSSNHPTSTLEKYQSTTLSLKNGTNASKHDPRASTKNMFPGDKGRLGLGNLGNTCFMNSMLQCLGQTGEMASIFLENPDKYHSKPLVKAYSDLMQRMWGHSGSSRDASGSFFPRELKDVFSRKNPQFSGFNQHDSQEFMRFLVSNLHDDIKELIKTKPSPPTEEIPEQWWRWYQKLENSPLLEVFMGQLCSTLTCLECNTSSKTFDPFWELSVSIPSSRSSHYSSSYATSHGSSSSVPLDKCIGVFTREETLEGDEKPYCGKCKSQQRGKKAISIQRLPKILVIHLKRFSSYGQRAKLDTSITIPHTLLLTDNSQSTHEYELYAVSNHSGSAYFGHYTAWCKHYSTGQWFSYNDSQVSSLKVPTPTFSSSNAYVLFYRSTKKSTGLKLTQL